MAACDDSYQNFLIPLVYPDLKVMTGGDESGWMEVVTQPAVMTQATQRTETSEVRLTL